MIGTQALGTQPLAAVDPVPEAANTNVAMPHGAGFNLSFEQTEDRKRLRAALERAVEGIEDAAEDVPAVAPMAVAARAAVRAAPALDHAAMRATVARINALLIEANRLYREHEDDEEAAMLLLVA